MGDILPFKSLTFEWYRAVKSNEYCRPCGWKPKDLGRLHFHHVNPKQKEHAVSQMVRADMPISNIIREMQKCVIVCDPCHIEIHAGRKRGWLMAKGDDAWKARLYMPFYPHADLPEVA